MRKPRLKAPETFEVAYYHCLSRIVDKQLLLGDVEKEQFVSFMKEYARFCGINIITYCVMGNHFHLLIKVPKRPELDYSDEELLQRLEQLSGMTGAGTLRQQLEWFRKQDHTEPAEEIRKRLLDRMWDVSAFMKLLKQRFTQWYNRRMGRQGTLWEQRFKSVLVEGAGKTLATMAAYIDLNPVRANLVADPKEYRWCGYAAALGGVMEAREGFKVVVGGLGQGAMEEPDVLATYRVWMHGQGEENEGVREDGTPIRKGMVRESVVEVIAAKGKLPVEEYLKCRVRYFSDGLVLGSRSFVDGIFQTFKSRFGPKRADGARRMKGLAFDLFAMRHLRKAVFG